MVREYQALYETYKENEDCKQRLEEIIGMYSGKKTLGRERAGVRGAM